MKKMVTRWARLIRETRGQDMVEYALVAGFLAVAAGATLPDISENIGVIFERTGEVLERAAGSEGSGETDHDAEPTF